MGLGQALVLWGAIIKPTWLNIIKDFTISDSISGTSPTEDCLSLSLLSMNAYCA
jgi:hypothetical protein